MKNNLKKLIDRLYSKYYFATVSKAWRNRYKHIDKELFQKNIDDDIINSYIDRWKGFGREVEIKTFLLCYNLSGKIQLDVVPENLFVTIIEKKLNPHKESSFFSLKSVYYKWYSSSSVFPYAYFHKIDGLYYDSEFQIIENVNEFVRTTPFDFPIILKASKDTYGGHGVRIIKNEDDLFYVLEEFNNFVCQEKLEQNAVLAEINNSSLNTIRTCLYRTKEGQFEVLNNSIRFGVSGGLDNETAGGLVCNIDDGGFLNSYAVDKYAHKYFHHPDSDIAFRNIKIPLYDELILQAKKVANELILCDLVSLDMSLDKEDNWRCIEINLSGQTIRFAQYAGRGFFGKYTDEVIDRCSRAVKESKDKY